MKKIFYTLLFALSWSIGSSQVIWSETFDTPDEGVTGACSGADISTCSSNVSPSNGQWYLDGDYSSFSASSDYFKTAFDGTLEARDAESEACFNTSVIDISASAEVSFTVTVSETGDHESADYVDVTYIIDGTPTLITNWNGVGSSSHTLVGDIPNDDDWGVETITQSGIVGDNLEVKICVKNNAGAEYINIDNLIVNEELAGGVPGIAVSEISGNTNESGTTATFTVELNSMPSAGVILDITSDDATEFSASPSNLSFSTSNWDTPQTVTVTGVEDFLNDCDITSTISVATDGSSADTDYTALSTTVDVTNEDNEVITLSELRINEVDSDTPGSDTEEFIELYGPADMPLCGIVLVLFNGSGDVSYDAIDLEGMSLDSDGFFMIGNSDTSPDIVKPSNFLQNGSEGVALFYGTAADWPNGTPANNTNLLDAIVYSSDDTIDEVLVAALALGVADEDVGLDEGSNGAKETSSVQRGSWFVSLATPRAANVLLPVEFSDIRVERVESGIQILWTTATEINNEKFEIERSIDGLNFNKLGEVRGQGNSAEFNDYEFIDTSPNSNNYYRIKQLDFDGKSTYSDIVSIESDKKSKVMISPTSTLDKITVNTNGSSHLSVRSMSGQVMHTQSDANGNFNIDMTHYPQGIYYLTIEMNGIIQTEKVIRL